MLLATTEALVGTQVETSHYEAFFRWRSENLTGYRGLYERFAVVVDRAAKEARKPDFASCEMGGATGNIAKDDTQYVRVSF